MTGEIVDSISNFIAPYLPALMAAGAHLSKGAIEEVGKQAGHAGFDYAKLIWHKLFPGDAPSGGMDAQTLAPIVQKTLTKDPALYEELALLIKTVEQTLNSGKPFEVMASGGIQVGSQVAKNIYNIEKIDNATFS